MSSDSNADLIATYDAFFQGNRAVCAVTALVVYEHLVTFKYEFDFIWKRKWSAATWIFVFNRYMLIANVVSSIAPYSPQVTLMQICGNAQAMHFLTLLANGGTMTKFPDIAFTGLRCFALMRNYSWKLPVTWTLATLSSAQLVSSVHSYKPGLMLISQYWDHPAIRSDIRFLSAFSNVEMANAVTAITLAAALLVVTLMSTARQVRQAFQLGLEATLSEMLLKYGTIFFLIDLFGDIFAVFANGVLLAAPVRLVMVSLLNVLPHILLSRFIINLRQIETPNDPSSDHHSTTVTNPNFRIPTIDDVVGNLGEPLEFIEYRVDEDEDGDWDDVRNDHRGAATVQERQI